MAQLWLQQEVKDLEGHETKGKYSPYLVVDHMAMINHMFAIKDIVASKKFAVIVPNAGENIFYESLLLYFCVVILTYKCRKRESMTFLLFSVVQQLDAMKKLDWRARNAIRWLEKQFQHGNDIFTCLTPYLHIDSICYLKGNITKYPYLISYLIFPEISIQFVYFL